VDFRATSYQTLVAALAGHGTVDHNYLDYLRNRYGC
jgi:hypothetical protein